MPVSFFPFSASHLPRTRSKPGPRCRTPFGLYFYYLPFGSSFSLDTPLSTLGFPTIFGVSTFSGGFFIFFTFKIRKGDLYYQTNHIGEDGLSIYIGSLFP